MAPEDVAGKPVILVVDPDEQSRNLLVRQLAGEPVQLRPAPTPSDAQAVLSIESPNVILADFRLPEMEGLAFLRSAHDAAPRALLLAMAARDDVGVLESSLGELPLHGLLVRPWDRQTLVGLVRTAVAQARLVGENQRLTALASEQHQKVRELQRTLDDMVGERTAILARGKRQWERTFDAITDPLMVIDREYRIVRANLTLAREHRLPISEVVGQRCYELRARTEHAFPLDAEQRCRGCPVTRALGGYPETRELEAASGRSFRVSAYPIASSEPGQLDWVACAYRDNTDERRLQRQLAQADKLAAIGRLAAGVAHEINNPLAGVLAFTQILRAGEGLGPGDSQSYLSEIEQGALRCKKIVDSLLSFSRQGRREGKRDLSLNDVVTDTLILVERQFAAARVKIERTLDLGLPLVHANGGQIQQVLLNLLTNAFDAMPEGGDIRIRTGSKEGYAELVVADQGCGIDEAHLAQLFEPFFTTKGNKGTGLGLAVSFGILKEHHGGIEISSRLGEGTSVRVWMPVVGRLSTRPPASAARSRTTSEHG